MIQFAANLSLLFQEWPLLQRFAAARDAGFEWVEVQFPYEASCDDVASAVAAAGVRVALINAPVIPEHRFGLACRPEARQQFDASLEQAALYAQTLSVRHVNVLAGRSVDAAERDTCHETLVRSLSQAVERLAPLDVLPLLEPINNHDIPGYFINRPRDAIALLERSGAGLLYDVYHVGAMGHDPRAELVDAFSWVKHVQFADAPGRHEPGSGGIAFEPVLDLLRDRAYTGLVAAEYRPSTTTLNSLDWLPRWRARVRPD